MSDNILEVKSLSKKYGKKQVLSEVSFHLNAGRITGLLGPNGAGKSTLIRILAGLENDYSGSVSIVGHTVGIESKKAVSYLPDRMALPQWLRVHEAVAMYADFFADHDAEKAASMLDRLQLDRNARISHLSKGMKDRLQLALAMSRNARLFLLDEPLAGVDPAARDMILRTILDSLNKDSTLLVSTHIIADMEPVFDDILFLKDGQIVLQGEAETLRGERGKSVDALFREVFACL